MKTLTFKFAGVIIFLFAGILAQADYEKNIHKGWAINKVEAFNIESKFSNINFINDRNDSVTVDILIEIDHPNRKKAEELAEQIDFVLYLRDGVIHAKTDFKDKFRTNQDFTISYTVNIPSDRDLAVVNKYGDVTLGDLNAMGVFEIKYGNIMGNNLLAPDDKNIQLDLKYSNGSFGDINRLVMEMAYGKMDADYIEVGQFDTQYSILNIDRLAKAIVTSKYDSYRIDESDNLSISSKFTGWEIDQLGTRFNIETEYGNIDIDQVTAGFESISVNNKYGNIAIGINKNASYTLEGDCYYCKIKHNEGEIIKEIEDNNHTYIKAIMGGSSPKAIVKIESRYGKIDLRED